MAGAAPATRQPVRENIPHATVALLAANEYGQDDYIKFAELARRAVPVGRLSAATRGDLTRSSRYRDIFIPHGWRDELRAVFTTGDAGWGFICLHREQSSPDFTASEARFLAGLTGHVAAGLRKALLIAAAPDSTAEPGPGVIEVTDQVELITFNQALATAEVSPSSSSQPRPPTWPPSSATGTACPEGKPKSARSPPAGYPPPRWRSACPFRPTPCKTT